MENKITRKMVRSPIVRTQEQPIQKQQIKEEVPQPQQELIDEIQEQQPIQEEKKSSIIVLEENGQQIPSIEVSDEVNYLTQISLSGYYAIDEVIDPKELVKAILLRIKARIQWLQEESHKAITK